MSDETTRRKLKRTFDPKTYWAFVERVSEQHDATVAQDAAHAETVARLEQAEAQVAALTAALRNIRLSASRGRSFGHQVAHHDAIVMAAKKDAALDQVLRFCADAGVVGSLLRDAAAPDGDVTP